jgi:hypothetical protein
MNTNNTIAYLSDGFIGFNPFVQASKDIIHANLGSQFLDVK